MFRKAGPLLFYLMLFWGCITQVHANPIPNANDYVPQVGEVLYYNVYVQNLIHGAVQTVRILSQEELDNRPVLKVQLSMETVGLVNRMTQYRETEDLTLDLAGLYPVILRREVKQKDGITIEEARFDYNRAIATREVTHADGSIESSMIKLPGYIQDAASLQFFLRKCQFNLGTNQLYFYSNGTVSTVDYTVTPGKAQIKSGSGLYSRYYQIDDPVDRITVMVTQDSSRLPFLIRQYTSFGKVEAKLIRTSINN